MNHTYFLPKYVVFFLFTWQVCFACLSILVLHRGYPSTSQTTCSAMNKRVPKFKREVSVMAREGMLLGQVIRFADKQPFAFPHLLYITFVQNSPSSSRGDSLALYFTATTDKITDRLKLKSYTEWSTVRITYLRHECCYKSSLHKQGEEEPISKSDPQTSYSDRGSKLYVLPYFSFELMFCT